MRTGGSEMLTDGIGAKIIYNAPSSKPWLWGPHWALSQNCYG